MRFERGQAETLLASFSELIKKIYFEYHSHYQENQFPGECPHLRADGQQIYLARATFPNLVHDQLKALIAIHNKIAAAKDHQEFPIHHELAVLGDTLQYNADIDHDVLRLLHETSCFLSVEERKAIRTKSAMQDVLSVLQDEETLEKALRCTEYFSDQFKEYAGRAGYLQALRERDLNADDISDHFSRVIPGLIKAFHASEKEKIASLNWNQCLTLYSVMAYVQAKYIEEDIKITQSVGMGEEAQSLHTSLRIAQKLLIPAENCVLSGRLDELTPFLPKQSMQQVVEPEQVNHQRDKEKEEGAPRQPLVREPNALPHQVKSSRYKYIHRGQRRFKPAIKNDINSFCKDFLRKYKLNGESYLGFSASEINGETPLDDEAMIDKVHGILGGAEKIDRKKVIDLMIAYEQITFHEVITELRNGIVGADQEGLVVTHSANSTTDDNDACFTVDVDVNGDVFINCSFDVTSFSVQSMSFEGIKVHVDIPASIDMRFKVTRLEGQLGLELIETRTTNKDIFAIWSGATFQKETLIKKYKDNVEEATEDQYQEMAVIQQEEAIKADEAFDYYVEHLQAAIQNQRYPQPVRASAQKVLDAVQQQKKKMLPKVSEDELKSVLMQTIEVVRTDANHPRFNEIKTNYETTANNFKSSAAKKIIGGLMIALLSVAIIVGCAMLMASTFGAGAAIGIPVLVGPALVPHFSAGMGVGLAVGSTLGFFGAKLFSRAATDYKLGKSMHELTQAKV